MSLSQSYPGVAPVPHPPSASFSRHSAHSQFDSSAHEPIPRSYSSTSIPLLDRTESGQNSSASRPSLPVRARSSMPSATTSVPTGRSQHHNAEAEFAPTWDGVIHSTQDALLIIEACLSGKLSHVPRRPHDKERGEQIKSGSIFVYEENASGIKRWTDGLTWSPSRIMGNFLVYRELEKPFPPGEKKRAVKRKRNAEDGYDPTETSVKAEAKPSPPVDSSATVVPNAERPAAQSTNFAASLSADEQRRLLGSLVDSYGFKEGGLVKKTMSVKYKGATHHIISYYSLEDVVGDSLTRPMYDTTLRTLVIRPELYSDQNFRAGLHDEADPYMPYHQMQPAAYHPHPHPHPAGMWVHPVNHPASTPYHFGHGPRDSVFEPAFVPQQQYPTLTTHITIAPTPALAPPHTQTHPTENACNPVFRYDSFPQPVVSNHGIPSSHATSLSLNNEWYNNPNASRGLELSNLVSAVDEPLSPPTFDPALYSAEEHHQSNGTQQLADGNEYSPNSQQVSSGEHFQPWATTTYY